MPHQHFPRFDELASLDTRLASGLCAGRTESTYVRITNPNMETLKHECYCVCLIVLLNFFLFTNTLRFDFSKVDG